MPCYNQLKSLFESLALGEPVLDCTEADISEFPDWLHAAPRLNHDFDERESKSRSIPGLLPHQATERPFNAERFLSETAIL